MPNTATHSVTNHGAFALAVSQSAPDFPIGSTKLGKRVGAPPWTRAENLPIRGTEPEREGQDLFSHPLLKSYQIASTSLDSTAPSWPRLHPFFPVLGDTPISLTLRLSSLA